MKQHDISAIKHLFKLINLRMSYMQGVAAYKAVHDLPIEDAESEKIVISRAGRLADDIGIDSIIVGMIFETQITIAKSIQNQWIKHWRKNGFSADATPLDLMGVIFPKLLIIGDKIVGQLNCLHKIILTENVYGILNENMSRIVNVQFIDQNMRDDLLNALIKITAISGKC